MKIKKKCIKSKRLIELYLLKSKTYESLKNENITDVLVNLKKAIQIIYKYHKKNKKILFIGIPKLLETKITRSTKHLIIPNHFKINKLLINSGTVKNIETKNQFVLSKKNQKPDLIITFNNTKTDSIIKKSYISKTLTIEFNVNNIQRQQNHSYRIPGKILTNNHKIINNIFFIILNSMFDRIKNDE